MFTYFYRGNQGEMNSNREQFTWKFKSSNQDYKEVGMFLDFSIHWL